MYKLKNNSVPEAALKSIYFSLFQSYLNYGLSVWGQTDQKYLNKIEITQNKILRLITGSDFDTPCNTIYNKLKVHKLKYLFHLKIASVMWDYDHKQLPTCFDNYSPYANTRHSYKTCFSQKLKVCEDEKFRTKTHGLNSFKFLGTKTLNRVKNKILFLQKI